MNDAAKVAAVAGARFELRAVGKAADGRRLWDVYDTVQADYVAAVPPFPTTRKLRAEECARSLNADFLRNQEGNGDG